MFNLLRAARERVRTSELEEQVAADRLTQLQAHELEHSASVGEDADLPTADRRRDKQEGGKPAVALAPETPVNTTLWQSPSAASDASARAPSS